MPAKKTGTSGRSTGRKPASKRTTTKKAPTYTKTAAQRPIRREVGSIVCFFLAIFSFLGFFKIEAIFINFFSGTLRGLIGYGFYAVPLILLVASFLLMFHRGRPVKLRVWSCFLLLPVFASILHLFISKTQYSGGFEIIKSLYADGNANTSGGVIGGLISIGFEIVFSKIGAAILLIGGIIVLLVLVTNISPLKVYEAIFKRERPQYVPEPEPEPVPVAPAPASVRRPIIDIPLDNGPTSRPQQASKGFFKKRSPDVKTPAEVLQGTVDPAQVAQPEQPVQESVEKIIEAMPVPEPVKAPESAKVNKAEEEAIKKDVIADIDSAMAAGTDEMYSYPPTSLLLQGKIGDTSDVNAELKLNAQRLVETIKSFNIDARLINVTRGPSVTRYELELDRGVKLMKLTGLSDDIALSLGARGVRIAPIPDKVSVVGIEVPNRTVSTVSLKDVLESKAFTNHKSKVAFALGKNIGGESLVGDIATLPHLLIAGTTGSGKSVCMNSLIISLLYKSSPEEVRLIMIDPKMIELNIYNGIPHLLIPVVTDPRKASGALQWAVSEMMSRYKKFSEHNVRDIFQYNEVALLNDEIEKLPQIVIVIDELADLMLVAAKEVEESVCRIAQMARAAGMHLIIATQRPSADVITGIMKANIPSRISFAVASQLESRIILDTTGAEKLVGKGDMLYFPLGAGKPTRIQGCLITSSEVERVVEYVKESGKTDYSEEIIEQIERSATEGDKGGTTAASVASEADEMLPQAVEVILDTGQASVSMLQRRLKLGYARAARLVDQLESRGIVGPFEGAKPRQLLITKEDWEEMKLQNPEYQ